MSLIHLYINKNTYDKNIPDLLKINNLDFLEYKVSDSEIAFHNIESVPAIKFKDKIIYNVNADTIKDICDQFNNYINTLPSVTKTTNYDIAKDMKLQDKKLTREIRLNTINIINKNTLSYNVKNFSKKYKE